MWMIKLHAVRTCAADVCEQSVLMLHGLMGIDVVQKWSLLICLEGQTWFVIFISSAWLTDNSKQL